MSSTIPLPPREQLYNRYCSNKHRVTGAGQLMLATRESLAQRNPPQDATREQEHCDAPDIEDDAHGRRKGRWVVGCAGEGRYSVPRGPAPGQVNSLNAWCKVTVLRLKGCGLGEGGGRALRLNTTVTSLDLFNNSLGEGGGRAIAQTLRLKTRLLRQTLAGMAWERAEGGRWQRHCASTPRLRRLTLPRRAWERAEGGRWRRHCASTHGYVALPWQEWRAIGEGHWCCRFVSAKLNYIVKLGRAGCVLLCFL